MSPDEVGGSPCLYWNIIIIIMNVLTSKSSLKFHIVSRINANVSFWISKMASNSVPSCPLNSASYVLALEHVNVEKKKKEHVNVVTSQTCATLAQGMGKNCSLKSFLFLAHGLLTFWF